MTTPLLLVLARRAFRRGRPAAGGVLAVGVLASLALLAATLSRGAWLALLAALLALVALPLRSGDRREARVLLAASAAAALVGAALLLTPTGVRFAERGRERIALAFDPSREPRAEFWQAAVAGFRARPWLGAGPDTFQLVYPAYQTSASWSERFDAAPEHAHNGILQLAACQGLLGLALLPVALVCLVRAARRALRRAESADERAMVAAPIAALVAWAVSVQFLFTLVATGSLAAVCAGLVAGRAAAEPGTAEDGEDGALGNALWMVGAGVAGAAVLLASALAAAAPSRASAWLAASAGSKPASRSARSAPSSSSSRSARR